MIVPRIVVGGVILSWLRRLVESWVDRILGASFRSIISLLEEAQLDRHYVRGGPDLHPGGLLGYYRHRGLEVASIPCTDYQRPSDDNLREAWLPSVGFPNQSCSIAAVVSTGARRSPRI